MKKIPIGRQTGETHIPIKRIHKVSQDHTRTYIGEIFLMFLFVVLLAIVCGIVANL